MPDPLHTHNFDHVQESDRQAQQHLAAPGVSILTSGKKHGSRNPTSDDAAHLTRSHDQKTDFAYAANPTTDNLFTGRAYALNGASNNTHGAPNTPAGPYRLTHGTQVNPVSNLNLASFGSQPWPTTSAPYLEFAPQPIYEPTGELVHETIQEFREFDDPSSLQYQDWQSRSPNLETINAAQSNTVIEVPKIATDIANTLKDAQAFIKPALKRTLEPDGGNEALQQRSSLQDYQESQLRKIRRVSFEQMSGTGPASADDEDSSSSDAPSATNRSTAGRATGNARRGRGSRHGTQPSQRPQPTAPSVTRPVSGPVTRGSRNPSAHPPSILPPEKVFPIQIGSELFRLSGASISSDAPSYFTQFFEDQIKQNEESGGVRTLYIDRDPETFRDVARHLQGRYLSVTRAFDSDAFRLLCQTQGRQSFCETLRGCTVLQL